MAQGGGAVLPRGTAGAPSGRRTARSRLSATSRQPPGLAFATGWSRELALSITTLRVNPQVQNFRGGQAVATLGRPHYQDIFGSGTAKNILIVGPPQCSYGLAPRMFWTCGFTLSVGVPKAAELLSDSSAPPQQS